MFYLAEWSGQRRRGRAIELRNVEVPHYAKANTVSNVMVHKARDPRPTSQDIIVAGTDHASSSWIPVSGADAFAMRPFSLETSLTLFGV